MEVYVGDKVQIKNNGMDITNGNKAVAGKKFGEGGPLWATVELVDPNWYTGGKFDLPDIVTKVRCKDDNGVVVWQVRSEDISDNIIRASKQDTSNVEISKEIAQSIQPIQNKRAVQRTIIRSNNKNNEELSSINPNVPYNVQEWTMGEIPKEGECDTIDTTNYASTKIITGTSMGINDTLTPNKVSGTWRDLNDNELKSIGSRSLKIDEGVISRSEFKTAFENPSKKREMLNDDIENIQNTEAFPKKSKESNGLMAARYDYRIIPGDNRYKKMISLEDKLEKARAAFGIHVHGNNMIARSVKYYMYNRFKVPDINLAHTKSFTHVFFTRPDLNLLGYNGSGNCVPVPQILNNTETEMLWKTNPELFKLLTDCSRCADSNNFNFLLSNQITSFSILDENLTAKEVGKSWNGHTMAYGNQYTGRTGGEFTVGFDETADYSVINFLKLWMTYIENVGNGAWSPSYNLRGYSGVAKNSEQDSHVYTRSLDYGAAVYVFKCGPNGDDVLYWTKYFGVFPLSTGASALSWQKGDEASGPLKLNINFRYCYKRDLSPISLIEFNNCAMVSDPISEPSFNLDYCHSSRPFVGPPFVQLKLPESELSSNGVNYSRNTSYVRLKFKKDCGNGLTDRLLYRADLS